MKYIVDRIEDNIVICENMKTILMENIDKSLLPKGIREGSVIVFLNNKYKIDKKEERLIRRRITNKFKSLRG